MTRSAIGCLEIGFDDCSRFFVEHCWVARAFIRVDEGGMANVWYCRTSKVLMPSVAMRYVLCIPALQESGVFCESTGAAVYHCVSSDWRLHGQNGLYSLPQLPPNLFQTWL